MLRKIRVPYYFRGTGMKSGISVILSFISFVVMMGLWFIVWFGTDWLHHYY